MPPDDRPQHMAEQQIAEDQIATMASMRERTNRRALTVEVVRGDLTCYNMSRSAYFKMYSFTLIYLLSTQFILISIFLCL